MKILLMHFLNTKNVKHKEILARFEQAVKNKGSSIEIFNGEEENSQIHPALFDYITVVVPADPIWGSKLPKKLTTFLSTNTSLSGKKGCAFVIKAGLTSGKMSKVLMAAMEKQGILLDYFDIIKSAQQALRSGENIG
ncbi:MAG: hypothetical protein ACRC5H_09560 [Treponemataceae bacterium]